MNFTDKYIKMCDCEEVQGHRSKRMNEYKLLLSGDHYIDSMDSNECYVYSLEENNAPGNFSF